MQRCSRDHPKTRQSRLLQSPVPGSKTRQPLEFLAFPKFKMESESIQVSLRRKEWGTSIDVTDIYLHIHIHPQWQKYLLPQRHHLSVYQPPVRPGHGPIYFQRGKGSQTVSLATRHQNLDDWLVQVPSKEECNKQTQKLLNLVRDLGFVVNLKKSELVPSQRFGFLG